MRNRLRAIALAMAFLVLLPGSTVVRADDGLDYSIVPVLDLAAGSHRSITCNIAGCVEVPETRTASAAAIHLQTSLASLSLAATWSDGRASPPSAARGLAVDSLGSIRLQLSGAAPNSVVRVYLNPSPVLLLETSTDVQGVAEVTALMLASTALGVHTVQVVFTSAGGRVSSAALAIEVALPVVHTQPQRFVIESIEPPTERTLMVGSEVRFRVGVAAIDALEALASAQLRAHGACAVKATITSVQSGRKLFDGACLTVIGENRAVLRFSVPASALGGMKVRVVFNPKSGAKVTRTSIYPVSLPRARYTVASASPAEGASLKGGSVVKFLARLEDAAGRTITGAIADSLRKCSTTVTVSAGNGRVLLRTACMSYNAAGKAALNWVAPADYTGPAKATFVYSEVGRTPGPLAVVYSITK